MSGHSKWSTIRHKKGAQDAKRGKIFSKIIKEITVAARLYGGDTESNPQLRAAILKAKGANMPKDNIDRAIKKGTGDLDGADYTELQYEGYGPGGIAILVSALTDNKNRTAADIRSIFSKNGGSLGETGCVSYLFRRKGVISYDASKYDEESLFELALEAGAEDVNQIGDIIEITTEPDTFEIVLSAMEASGMKHERAELAMVPENTVTVGNDKARKVLFLVDILDDHDDVQDIFTNLSIPDNFSMED